MTFFEAMPSFPSERSHPPGLIGRLGTAALGALAVATATVLSPVGTAPALAQGTPGLMEFRWENNKDYRKLYFFTTDTVRMQRAEYYLMLRPKDRKTAILKLSISVPSHFDTKIDPKQVKLCRMSEGGC